MAAFERDIVLANDDGKVYHIPQETLNQLEAVDLKSPKYELISGLLRQGVTAAAIPTLDDPGPEPDAFCYLVNLGALKQAQPYE
jgi:hypothetical protein